MNGGKKRKGRPPKNNTQIPETTPEKHLSPDSTPVNPRSTRHNPNQSQLHSKDDYEYEDDDDERKEKKVKLVVRLPKEPEEKADEKDVELNKKRKSYGSEGELSDQDTKFVAEAADTPIRGSQLDSGPTTPLVEKKLLVFILDRLQKKDTYGVFSKPVDPEELPDYFDIIEKPMDFGTLRKKLDSGGYGNLEELEADVFLICSNAMQYNSPDTVYYRQARAMQELAKRDFENLRHEGDDGEPQPKVVRRGRPPSNNNLQKIVEEKKPVESLAADRVGTELSSGATLASADDKATEISAFNLRKASTPYKFQLTEPFLSSYQSRFSENRTEWTSDWSDFPAHILRADMKYGNKHFTVDENRRDTYRQLHPPASSGINAANYVGDLRRLVPIGLQDSLAQARSLARYAANLGPVAWKFASRKIEYVLPAGIKYGRGWVGDCSENTQQQYSFLQKMILNTMPSDPGPSKLSFDSNTVNAHAPSGKRVEAIRKLNDQKEFSGKSDPSSLSSRFLAQQNLMNHPYRNGFSQMLGYNNISVPGNARTSNPGHSVSGVSVPQMVERASTNTNGIQDTTSTPVNPTGQFSIDVAGTHGKVDTRNLGNSTWQSVPIQQKCNNDSMSVPPPDLNVRIPAGSPSSSLQQPDLDLQL